MDKLKLLKDLKEIININCYGTENLSSDQPYIFVSNHNCLLDVLYLPMTLDFPIVELISSRLIFNKEDIKRFKLINDHLYTMPIEAHGGPKYSNLCLSSGVELLKNGISLSIFPEGAYIKEKIIHKGRTGAIRILYDAVRENVPVNLVPVAIDVKGEYELDSYDIKDNNVDIHFLEPIEYDNSFAQYNSTNNYEEKNKALHKPMDQAMQNIAKKLERPADLEYIRLNPKGNIMTFEGHKIPTPKLNETDYLKYQKDINERLEKQLSLLKK